MQRVAFPPLVLLVTLGAASRLHRSRGRLAADQQDHPVGKVIALLKDLSKDVLKQAQEEEHLYGKFDKWCKDSDKTLSDAISTGKEKIDSLKDKVSSLEKEEKSLEKSIGELEDEIKEHETASTEAKEDRDEENGIWKESDKDLTKTIEAISQALDAMKESEASTSELLQRKVGKLLQTPMLLAQLTSQQKELLRRAGSAPDDADDDDDAGTSTPRPDLLSEGDLSKHQKVYEFKADSVTELLKELKMKFEDDLVEATKAETNAQNAYELTDDARQKAIKTAKSSKKEKETILGDVQTDLEDTKGTLKGRVDDLEVDEKSLASTQDACKLKASEYATRVELQKGEQEAMAKAVEILEKVSGVRHEQPENPVPPPSPLESFLQMPPKASAERKRALGLLRRAARKSRSQEFAGLVERVAAAADGPFEEVNDMMQKMIFRLMAEQKDEDEHKAWCDKELEEVNISMADKEEKIEVLDAKIKKGKATVNELSEEIKDADEMVATLESHMEEATQVREAATAENKAAIKDAQDAQTAIAQATAVLEQFYKESGAIEKEAYEFVQQREPVEVPENPATWDASYTGIADPNNAPGGIVSMLKEISADFAKMEADTLATEQMDQKAYEEEMKECKIGKAERAKESEMKADEKRRLLDKIATHEKSHKHTSNEIEAVEQYLKDLGPACIEGDSTYDERKAARQEEIEALKEAQVILEEAFDEGAAPAPAPEFFEIQAVQVPPRLGLRSRIAKRTSDLDAHQLRAAAIQEPQSAEVDVANQTATNPTAGQRTFLLSPHAGYWGRGIKSRIDEELAGAGPEAQNTSTGGAHSVASFISSFFSHVLPIH